MRVRFTGLRRSSFGAIALAIAVVAAAPSLMGNVAAAGQVQSRSVQLSSSVAAATATKYTITFTPATTGTIGGIVVDFCGDSPIIGSTTCTLPGTGFTLGTSVTLTAGYTGMGSGWATTNSLQGAAAASNKQVAVLTNGTPQSVSTATPIVFELTGITNPPTNGTFYARIYTFDTSANTTTNYTATGTTRAASPGGRVDYGGAAMSIANPINITAVVQEQITFCVSGSAPTSGCGGVTSPDMTLGTGTPKVLTTAISTGTAYDQLTSNANNNGVTVRLRTTSSTACSGLSADGGATCGIAAKGAFGTLAASSGTFGLNVANSTGGSGTVTANGNYGTTAGSYGMGTAVYGQYGDPIQSTTAPVTNANSTLTYAAAAAATTAAGVYTTTHTYIATGSY